MQSIDNNAFCFCLKLDDVILPSSLQSLGMGVFSCCSDLTNITFSSEVPPSMPETEMFYSCSMLSVILVPANSVEAYKTAFSRYAGMVRSN